MTKQEMLVHTMTVVADAHVQQYIVEQCHIEALRINATFKYSAKELYADSRLQKFADKKLSVLTHSVRKYTQCSAIETALQEYRTLAEIREYAISLFNDDIKENRVKTHISHLRTKFQQTCKIEIHEQDVAKLQIHQRFRIILK